MEFRPRLVFFYPDSNSKALAPGFYVSRIPTVGGPAALVNDEEVSIGGTSYFKEELRRLLFELHISGVHSIALVDFQDEVLNQSLKNEVRSAGLRPLTARFMPEDESYLIYDESAELWGQLQSLGAEKFHRIDEAPRHSWFIPKGPAFLPRLWLQKIKLLQLEDKRGFVLEPVGFRHVSESCLRSMRRAVDGAARDPDELDFSLILPFTDFDGRWKKAMIEFLEAHQFENFEVICVFNTENPVSPKIRSEAFEFFRQEKTSKMRFAGVSFQWIEARFRPDVFRAGLSRNLGAHYARSEFLLFMDADMRLPESYRPWLTPEFVSLTRRWDVIDNPVRRLKMEKYWEDFNWRGEELLREPKGWKYLCSHSLGISKDNFEDLGAFSWIYQKYGHEDTELAYRIWRENLPVYLHEESSLHFRATSDSNPLERQESLQETGFLFLQTHPVLEVAEFAEYLWSLGFRIGKKLKKSKKMAGSLFWKGYGDRTPKPPTPEAPTPL